MSLRIGALLAVIACAACRDGVAPFEKVQPEPETGPVRRLTWNPRSDEDPTWSRNGDTLYYTTAAGFFDLPRYPRTMLRIPSDGGDATMLAKSAQFDEGAREILPALARPVLSPDGSRIAYLEFRCTPCTNCVARSDCQNPGLDFVMLRVRSATAITHAYKDHGIRIDPVPGTYRGSDYGVSWSPDGQSIVFSDQTQLRIWHTANDDADVIPNTAGGMSPAWSPAGDAIAFSRRTGAGGGSSNTARLQLTSINGVITDLVDGTEPAWSADGSAIYFVSNARVNRITRGTSASEAVPGTDGGRTPSVSPDGRHIAVARAQPADSTAYDIYVVDMGSAQK